MGSNPEKRMPLATLQKCEDVLKKMNLPDIDVGPEGSNSALPPSSFNPLLEAVLKSRSSQGPQLNHWLSRTFLPPLNAVVGQEISLPPCQPHPQILRRRMRFQMFCKERSQDLSQDLRCGFQVANQVVALAV